MNIGFPIMVASQFVCLKWTIEKVINNRHPAR